MAVAESAGVELDSSSQNLDNHNSTLVSTVSNSSPNDQNAANPRNDSAVKNKELIIQNDHNTELLSAAQEVGLMQNGFNGVGDNGISNERFNSEMRDLVEMLSKLNPKAEEFVPPSLARARNPGFQGNMNGFNNNFMVEAYSADSNGSFTRRRRNGYGNGMRRVTTRTSMAQQEEVIRRTVYVSDIDHHVTEEHLAGLFLSCGQVVDCRICGDTSSILRFAFVEFTDEDGARAALNLSGTMIGYYPLRVHPSKTAIAPVNPTFLPRSEDEREMCSRTIYCTNIDKKVTEADVRVFFESFCGKVQRLRLLGDYHHHTRIGFVEFMLAESAILALSCSGVVLGTLPIRVSPSKTPVRPRIPRPQLD